MTGKSLDRAAALFALFAFTCPAQTADGRIRPAVVKSVALLQKASLEWYKHQTCVSCHQQALPMLMFAEARSRGIALDERNLAEVMTLSFGYMADLDRAVQGSYIIDPVMGDGYTMIPAALLGMPRSASTGAYARLVARRQRDDGQWVNIDERPPQSFSNFTSTAIGIRMLRTFLPGQMDAEGEARIGKARVWLASATPIDTEDRAYQLLGLNWAGASAESLSGLRDQLVSLQQEDGGWGQYPGRTSDSYATGLAMYALHRAAALPVDAPAYRKGIDYLLRTQKPDGTWFVPTRLHPPAPVSPPYFESGLPYGHSQFVSAMGTSWASLALLQTLPESAPPPQPLQFPALQPASVPAWAETILFGSTADVRKLLDAGFDPNSATPKGTTALMMAAADPEKLALLIERGADVNAKSRTRYTALMLAASHQATESVRLLLDKNAEVMPAKGEAGAMFGANALFMAVWSGDIRSMEMLSAKGASLTAPVRLGGTSTNRPMDAAIYQGDAAMVSALLRAGANVEQPDPSTGINLLDAAILKNDVKIAELLIANKANVNHVDKLGYTPLHWAANIDYGDSVMVKLLLQAGADPNARNKGGLTPVQLAAKFKSTGHQAALQGALRASLAH
jgi:ankyrin repeat protein